MSLGDIMRQKLEKQAAEDSAARAAEQAKADAEKQQAEAAAGAAHSPGCKYKDEPYYAHTILHVRDSIEDVLNDIVHGSKMELPGDLDFDRSVLIDDLREIRDKLNRSANKARSISTALDARQKKLEGQSGEPKCDDHQDHPGH